MERTFTMLKPGVLQRRIAGEILSRLEKKGFHVVALKMIQLSKDLARKHYEEHVNKVFYPEMEEYIMSGPVIVMVLEGPDAVKILRSVVGPTFSPGAPSGTIRGDYGFSMTNIIHASDSIESAKKEISIYFKDEEILTYSDNNRALID